MNTRKLHDQADRIEWVLNTHQAPARVTGGRVTPAAIQFHLTPEPNTNAKQVQKLSDEIAVALGTLHAQVTHNRDHIEIRVPRDSTAHVSFLRLADHMRADEQLHRALRVPGTALLGLSTDRVPLMVRLSSPDIAHMLVSGAKASGKTEALKTILASLVLFQKPSDIQLLLIDPKATSFQFLSAMPHLLGGIASTVEEALRSLRWLASEMERRETQQVTQPRLVVVVDELADLLTEGGRELQVHLTRLAQRGRSAGISLLAATNNPGASILGGALKGNFPVRLVGKMPANSAHPAGAEKLVGRGDFVLVAGGERVRFQAAYLAPQDLPAYHVQVRARADTRGASSTFSLNTMLKRLLGGATTS